MPTSPFEDFVAIVAKLRQECPWDKKQTHISLRKHLLEEAYETLEAIDKLSEALDGQDVRAQDLAAKELCDELGDLLYQVFFHSLLASERGDFDVLDVLDAIHSKLVRRHPHVFGDLEVESEEELAPHWEAIKKQESDRQSVMDGIPTALPALLYAAKVQRKAASLGAVQTESTATAGSVMEFVTELRYKLEEVLAGGLVEAPPPVVSPHVVSLPVALESILGELLFAVTNLARQNGVDCEAALRAKTDSFRKQFSELENSRTDLSSPEAIEKLYGQTSQWDLYT